MASYLQISISRSGKYGVTELTNPTSACGAAMLLVLGNGIAFLRSRRPIIPSDPTTPSSYFAPPEARRIVNFKGEDESDGEEIGPVFITDEDDPAFVYEIGWMKMSDAQKIARQLGHPFNDDR